MAGQKGVKIAAVCDPDRTRSAAAAKLCEEHYQQKVDQYADVRKLLDRKEIDVMCIATQQYWHALGTIWACQAGKHVYVEKPASHYIWEGRQMVNAARHYQPHRPVRHAAALEQRHPGRGGVDRAGNLGPIKLITAFANKPRVSVGKRKLPLPIPPEVDYDLWCGPAKKLPIYRDNLQYDCSFDWNTGDGESANQGVHEIDLARWMLGETELPRRVMSIGGRFVFNDAADCPTRRSSTTTSPPRPCSTRSTTCGRPRAPRQIPSSAGMRVGVAVDCEGGSVLISNGGKALDKQGNTIKTFRRRRRSLRQLHPGRPQRPAARSCNAEILEGHLSTRICHAGNISYRLGRQGRARTRFAR